MNIIIVGAGRVGGTLCAYMAKEANDITLVDIDNDRLMELQSRLDIRTVSGQASHPDTLKKAGGEDADMIIAVTNSDETNMMVCQVASSLYQTPKKIARVRAEGYLAFSELFQRNEIPVDVCISPEQLVTEHIYRLIEHPGTLDVLEFAEGRIQLVETQPGYGGPIVGKTINSMHEYLPEVSMRVVAIYRDNKPIDLSGRTTIEVGDNVFFMASPVHIRELLLALGREGMPNQRVMIVGGGHIGARLARMLESIYDVKIIDHNDKRVHALVEQLNDAVVLHGDASDQELLKDESIEYIDVFCAVTNDDEANILSCMQAKKLGAKQTVAIINRSTYIDLIQGGAIDVAISPQHITIGSILTHMRHADMANVYSLRGGEAEAIEIIVHGDEKTSKVVGRKLASLKLPTGCTIGAVVREEKVIFAQKDLILETEDHVLMFFVDRASIPEVEQLFQVKLNFFK